MSVTVYTDVFAPPGTRATVNQYADGAPTLTIYGQNLRVSFCTIDKADPDYLAFARSLRVAAEEFVRAYETTFLTADKHERNPAA